MQANSEEQRPSSLPQVEDLNSMISTVTPATAAVLDRALSGEDITPDEAAILFDVRGQDYNALVMAADELRRRTVGDVVR